jgi:hypothetical protein
VPRREEKTRRRRSGGEVESFRKDVDEKVQIHTKMADIQTPA